MKETGAIPEVMYGRMGFIPDTNFARERVDKPDMYHKRCAINLKLSATIYSGSYAR